MGDTIGKEFRVGRNKYLVSVRTTRYFGQVRKSVAKIVNIGETVQNCSEKDMQFFCGQAGAGCLERRTTPREL